MQNQTMLAAALFAGVSGFATAGAAQEKADRPKEEIFVTGAAFGERQFDVLQGSTVVSGDELRRRAESTIGETLSFEPGINSTSFAPGASRPVIRGLGGDRIRVLIGGIGTFDASTTSPDHAVAVEPLSVNSVEIIRGPATLLYGSSATGGVVNMLDGRIPVALPEDGVDGAAQVLYGTVDDEKSGAAYFDAAIGNLVFHIDGFARDTNDFEIDGFPISDRFRRILEEEGEEIDEQRGIVTNSDVESFGGTIGASYVWDGGFFGIAVNHNEGNYGIPADLEEEEEEPGGGEEGEEEGGVRIDMEQTRVDVMGEAAFDGGPFSKLELRFGAGDYEHAEIEGEAVGTVFKNDGWEGRVELAHRPLNRLQGSFGVQLRRRDFSAVGAEAFVPPTETFQWGLFAVEKISFGTLDFQAGARLEGQSTEDIDNDRERDFTGVNFSAGAAYHPGDDVLFGLNISRTERAPTPEELFSDGPHVATQAFEIGLAEAVKEKALNIEATAKKRGGRLTGQVNFFYTDYQDFLFEDPTGDTEDGLPVFVFTQSDASFYGGEIEAQYEAFSDGLRAVYLTGILDFVRAGAGPMTEPLPRIPPLRLLGAVDYRGDHFDARLSLRWAAEQDRVADFELPTDDYASLNASLTYRPFPGEHDVAIMLRGKNLTDSEIRNHVSFLKDLVPQPGRDVRLSVTARF